MLLIQRTKKKYLLLHEEVKMIKITTFGGVVPKIAARLLPDTAATVAYNCDLRNGNLKPLRNANYVRDIEANTKSLHRFTSDFWFQWDKDIDCVSGPFPQDTESRTYFTGDGEPKITYAGLATTGAEPYPSNSYLLGVPAPTVTPAATASGTASNAEAIPSSRIYTYTYVTEKGEEGPPSPPSAVTDWLPGQTVSISQMEAVPNGNYNVDRKRIYRYAQGASSGNYFFVAEISDAETEFEDTLDDVELPGGMLVTTEYDPPPEDMAGLINLPNGVMAGFSGKELCFCEPYLPYAWPVKYRRTVDYDIVGLGSIGNGVAVLTKGQPYLVAGAHPSNMTMQKLDVDQSCVSKRSIVSDGNSTIFASPDGLFMVSLNGAQNITRNLFSREQWRSLKPEMILGVMDEGSYIGFYDDGTTKGSFILDPNNENANLTFSSMFADACYRDLEEDILYLAQGTQLVSWDSVSTLSYSWRSKTFVLGRKGNFALVNVLAGGPVTLNVYADDVLRFSGVAQPDAMLRLPSGFLGRNWYVEVLGNTEIEEIVLAYNVKELDYGQ